MYTSVLKTQTFTNKGHSSQAVTSKQFSPHRPSVQSAWSCSWNDPQPEWSLSKPQRPHDHLREWVRCGMGSLGHKQEPQCALNRHSRNKKLKTNTMYFNATHSVLIKNLQNERDLRGGALSQAGLPGSGTALCPRSPRSRRHPRRPAARLTKGPRRRVGWGERHTGRAAVPSLTSGLALRPPRH